MRHEIFRLVKARLTLSHQEIKVFNAINDKGVSTWQNVNIVAIPPLREVLVPRVPLKLTWWKFQASAFIVVIQSSRVAHVARALTSTMKLIMDLKSVFIAAIWPVRAALVAKALAEDMSWGISKWVCSFTNP